MIYHDEDEFPYYGLHEVYYSKDSSISAWTIDADVVGNDKEDLISSLEMMTKDAKDRDVLIGSSLKLNIKDQ